MYKLQYIVCMEDSLYAVIAKEVWEQKICSFQPYHQRQMEII